MDIIGRSFGKFKNWVNSVLDAHTASASAHHTDHKVASTEDAEFSKVNVVTGEGYYQDNILILKSKAVGNLFVGIEAGKVSNSSYNSFVGYHAGQSNTTGIRNNFAGAFAGTKNTTGAYNNFIGFYAGTKNTTNSYNNFMGAHTGRFSTGGNNNFLGYAAGYSNITGNYNCYVGSHSGYYGIGGTHNNFIGNAAGYYETGSYKFFVDVIPRTNEADGRIKSLIYGIFNAATANQLLRINGILELTEIKSGATQAGAGATADEVWKTNGHATLPDNVLMIGV